MAGIPETVKISDGKGGFSTINKSNFQEGVHELYEAGASEVDASVVESAEIFSESEEEEEEEKEEFEDDDEDIDPASNE